MILANMLDYIDWRGDLTFEQSGFCEIDNLIFSMLSFVDLSKIVPENPVFKSIRLSQAVKLYDKRYEGMEEHLGAIVPDVIIEMFRKAAACERYRDIRLCGFVNEVDEKLPMQFAALTLLLPDKTIFISFRGTDDTIAGWQEDFNMSFSSPVPSQNRAVEYLCEVAAARSGGIRTGGHSKGGNLAVFAAAHCGEEIQARILQAYSNDGPGFDEGMLSKAEYVRINGRITTFVPQSSVVGLLLEHDEDYQVIKSTQNAILQHDPFSWEVLGRSFIHLDGLSKAGMRNDDALKKWIGSMTMEERREFTEVFFSVLESTEAKTLTELGGNRLKNIVTMLKTFTSLDKEKRDVMIRISARLFGSQKKTEKEEKPEKS